MRESGGARAWRITTACSCRESYGTLLSQPQLQAFVSTKVQPFALRGILFFPFLTFVIPILVQPCQSKVSTPICPFPPLSDILFPLIHPEAPFHRPSYRPFRPLSLSSSPLNCSFTLIPSSNLFLAAVRSNNLASLSAFNLLSNSLNL